VNVFEILFWHVLRSIDHSALVDRTAENGINRRMHGATVNNILDVFDPTGLQVSNLFNLTLVPGQLAVQGIAVRQMDSETFERDVLEQGNVGRGHSH
jgi:hypothetical protein